jgi:hypothetical protein
MRYQVSHEYEPKGSPITWEKAGQEALKRKPFQMFHRYAQFQSFQSLADQKTETYN